MKIVVCIKQVPNTVQLKFDGQDNPMLDTMEWGMNACCSYAVETALQLKEAQEGSTVTAISLGKDKAKDVLKRAIAMGCDEAYHLSAAAAANMDAWATANLLTAAIQKIVPDYHLLIFGQYTDDAMQSITGPLAAEILNLPSITLASKVTFTDSEHLQVERQTELGLEVHELTLPGLICMANSDVDPRIPSIKGVMRANRTEIPVMDAATFGESAGNLLETVSTIRKPKKSGGSKIDGSDAQAAVDQLITYLKTQKAL